MPRRVVSRFQNIYPTIGGILNKNCPFSYGSVNFWHISSKVGITINCLFERSRNKVTKYCVGHRKYFISILSITERMRGYGCNVKNFPAGGWTTQQSKICDHAYSLPHTYHSHEILYVVRWWPKDVSSKNGLNYILKLRRYFWQKVDFLRFYWTDFDQIWHEWPLGIGEGLARKFFENFETGEVCWTKKIDFLEVRDELPERYEYQSNRLDETKPRMYKKFENFKTEEVFLTKNRFFGCSTGPILTKFGLNGRQV